MNRGCIWAEFGKDNYYLGLDYFLLKGNNRSFRIISFYGERTKDYLSFKNLLDTSFQPATTHLLCGHNGKEFDFPYISKTNDYQQIDFLPCNKLDL